MVLNSTKKEEVIVVVGDPLEAVALPFIQETYHVKKVIVLSYIEYEASSLSRTTSQIVNYVLDRDVKVFPLFIARYHTVGVGSLFRKLLFNKTELMKYSTEFFQGQLFSGSPKLVLNSNSPLRRFLGRKSNYIGLSHSPLDDLEANIDLPLREKVYWNMGSKKKFFWVRAPISHFYRFLFSVICFNAKPWIPFHSFTWLPVPEDKTTTQVDLSYWRKESVISDLTSKMFPTEKLDLLFFSFESQGSYGSRMEWIDASVDSSLRIYSQFGDGKVPLLLKFHWKDLDVISVSERAYLNARVRQEIFLLGVNKVLFFDDFIDKKYREWPAEIFLKAINIRQILGAFTGAMYVASGMGFDIKSYCESEPLRLKRDFYTKMQKINLSNVTAV